MIVAIYRRMDIAGTAEQSHHGRRLGLTPDLKSTDQRDQVTSFSLATNKFYMISI